MAEAEGAAEVNSQKFVSDLAISVKQVAAAHGIGEIKDFNIEATRRYDYANRYNVLIVFNFEPSTQ